MELFVAFCLRLKMALSEWYLQCFPCFPANSDRNISMVSVSIRKGVSVKLYDLIRWDLGLNVMSPIPQIKAILYTSVKVDIGA
jgi:hypothetical protein